MSGSTPIVSVLVPTGTQIGLVRLVAASTTTSALVAQEILKPNWLFWTPKLRREAQDHWIWKIPWCRRATAKGRPPARGPRQVIDGRIVGTVEHRSHQRSGRSP